MWVCLVVLRCFRCQRRSAQRDTGGLDLVMMTSKMKINKTMMIMIMIMDDDDEEEEVLVLVLVVVLPVVLVDLVVDETIMHLTTWRWEGRWGLRIEKPSSTMKTCCVFHDKYGIELQSNERQWVWLQHWPFPGATHVRSSVLPAHPIAKTVTIAYLGISGFSAFGIRSCMNLLQFLSYKHHTNFYFLVANGDSAIQSMCPQMGCVGKIQFLPGRSSGWIPKIANPTDVPFICEIFVKIWWSMTLVACAFYQELHWFTRCLRCSGMIIIALSWTTAWANGDLTEIRVHVNL